MVLWHCCVGFDFEFALLLGFTFPRPDICHPYNSQRDYKSPWTDVKHEAIFSNYLGEKKFHIWVAGLVGHIEPPKSVCCCVPKLFYLSYFFLIFSVQFWYPSLECEYLLLIFYQFSFWWFVFLPSLLVDISILSYIF